MVRVPALGVPLMLWVTLAAALSNGAIAVAFLRWSARRERQAARREELLLARICHLADRPWEPAPADTWQPEPEVETDDGPVLIANPEQWSF